MKKGNADVPPNNFASLLRGFYGRVAIRLRVDPSYVSRVARGERQSAEIEKALRQEMRRVMNLLKVSSNGSRRRLSSHSGANRRRIVTPRMVDKRRAKA